MCKSFWLTFHEKDTYILCWFTELFFLPVFDGAPPPPGQLCPGEDSKFVCFNWTCIIPVYIYTYNNSTVAMVVFKGAFIKGEVLGGGKKSDGLMAMRLHQKDLL